MSIHNDLMSYLEKLFGFTTESFCDLETSESEMTLVDDQGGYATLIALDGSSNIFDGDDLSGTADELARRLARMFSARHHQVDITHNHEPYNRDAYGGQINYFLSGQRQAARQMGLDVDELITSQELVMEKHCHVEQTYIVVRTAPHEMPKHERKRAREILEKARAQHAPKGNETLPRVPTDADHVQNHNLSNSNFLSKHESAVQNVVTVFSRLGYFLRVLEVHNALLAIRMMINRERTPENWRPRLPGDRMSIRLLRSFGPPDPADILHPSLERQLFPTPLEVEDHYQFRIGSRTFRGVTFDLPPSDLDGFGALQTGLLRADKQMPWRITWRLHGDGLRYDSLKKFLISFLRFVPGPNSKIAKDFEELKKRFDNNEPIVGLAMDAVTWVDTQDQDLLERRVNTLARTIESWGGPQVKDTVGHPVESWSATVPGLRRRSPSPLSAAPASDVLLTVPLARSSSPWRDIANCLFRTPDGKLWPYRAYSRIQNAWITLVYAPMGMGKSVSLSALNKGLVLDPENTDLPLIRLLDFGVSSTGFINLIKYALPKNRRHQVGYFKMKNDREHAINSFDLPLGLRRPLPSHESFLIEFLTSLCTPLGQNAPPDGVVGLVRRIVEIAYEKYDDISPKVYSKAAEPAVDQAIARHGIPVDPHTTWHELRDALFFEANDVHAATLAHRCAMPTLPDVAASAMDETVRASYGAKLIDGEPLNDYVYRTLTAAVGLYPVLGDRTRFDLGDARIVSLDLNEVAPKGSQQAQRQSAIMYMIAMRVLVADFSFSEEDVAYCPEAYKDYFLKVIRRNNRVPKRFLADEFHRTSSSPAAREGVLVLIREGRKWRLETILASQILSDFDEDMIDLATTTMIFGTGNASAEETAKTFKLGNAGEDLCARSLNGPGPGGSNFIGVFKTKKKTHTALLTLTLSAMELWAYNSTATDRDIRDAMYRVMPIMDALRVLAHEFPSGTASDAIEQMVNQRIASGGASGDELNTSFAEQITSKLIKMAPRVLEQAKAAKAA